MKNWTDKCINWHQLPGTEVRRLLDTWGMTERQIANYDAKHGYTNTAKTSTKVVETAPEPARAEKPAKPATKKVVKTPQRQRHTGADGEVKFVEHRNLYVGFFGNKVVVTKRTREQCLEVLRKDYKLEV